jgi:hypothetical protein
VSGCPRAVRLLWDSADRSWTPVNCLPQAPTLRRTGCRRRLVRGHVHESLDLWVLGSSPSGSPTNPSLRSSSGRV